MRSFDLGFRPSGYRDVLSPADAIVQNVLGENRRRLLADRLEGSGGTRLPEDDELLQDILDDSSRNRLSAINPSWMGGEYLPPYRKGEVEIARIVLQSTTQDVYAFRARPTQTGYAYRFVDEYKTRWKPRRMTSRIPLSLGELIALIDVADDCGGGERKAHSFVENIVAWQLENDDDAASACDFVAVRSIVYADLEPYYADRITDFVDRWRSRTKR